MNLNEKRGGEKTPFIVSLALSVLLVSLVTAALSGAVGNEQREATSRSSPFSSSPSSTRPLDLAVTPAMTTNASLRAQIEERLDAGPVVLFFYADWCPYCHQQLPFLEAVENHYAPELAVMRINVDEQPGDAEAFGVRELPTILVITGKGNGGYITHEISKFSEITMPEDARAPDMRQAPPGVQAAAGDVLCDSCEDCSEKLASGLYDTVLLAHDIGNRTGSCINFSATNATFDCSGHIIGGDLLADPFGVDYGIKLTGTDNVIKNCSVAFFWYGIWLDNAQFTTITQNNVGLNAYSGLAVVNSSSNIIAANTILFNSYGLSLVNSSNTTVDANVVCGNLVADMWQEFSSGNSGTNNTCSTTHNWNDTGTVNCTYLCCIAPYDNMRIDKDTVLCPGEYHLNDSANPGVIIINNSDITLDCNHASLIGNGSGIGIYNADHDNVTIKNCNMSNYDEGIKVGIVNYNTLTDNTATSNNYYGISLDFSSNNNLTGNTASQNAIGIYLTNSSSNTLTGNAANSNNHYGVLLESSSNNNTLTENIASSNILHGIYLSSSNYNTLADNTAAHNYYGIYLDYSSTTNNLRGNTASQNAIGIFLKAFSNGNILRGNTASSNTYYGIALELSSTSMLMGNTASSNNHHGILLDSSNSNTLTDNTATSNKNGGMYLNSSNSNTLTGNTVNLNNNYGIYLSHSSTNAIYNNYFENALNAYDDGANSWNITKTAGTNIIGGSWLGGNYWSDYAGEDTDGDGLGDTLLPYNSSGEVQNGGDWLPLVATGMLPRWDINEDGAVDDLDLGLLLLHYGETTSPPYPRWDINEDGAVDDLDLGLLLLHYGE